MHATRNPDGSFSYDGLRYRLVERADGSNAIDVVGERTGDVIGTLVPVPRANSEPHLEIQSAEPHHQTVRAISTLLETVRGALPLQ